MHDYDSWRESLGLLVIVRCYRPLWPFIYILGRIYRICILCDVGIYICYDGYDFENIKLNVFKMVNKFLS